MFLESVDRIFCYASQPSTVVWPTAHTKSVVYACADRLQLAAILVVQAIQPIGWDEIQIRVAGRAVSTVTMPHTARIIAKIERVRVSLAKVCPVAGFGFARGRIHP
jgi:hypothetical protein